MKLSTHQMEETIGLILLIGTLCSALLVFFGGTMYLLQNGTENIHFEHLQADTYQNTIKQVWHLVLLFSPLGIIELGLLTLVATQILRVALLFFYYASQGDFWFTLISIFILLTLIYSFVWRT